VEANKVFAIGIIVNELITNARKYAFPEGRGGVISVGLQTTETGFTLTVADNGVGLGREVPRPAGDKPVSGGFGLELVRSLARQYRADLVVSGETGSEFRFEFSG
jgi:two-component sensor histidine kinase